MDQSSLLAPVRPVPGSGFSWSYHWVRCQAEKCHWVSVATATETEAWAKHSEHVLVEHP